MMKDDRPAVQLCSIGEDHALFRDAVDVRRPVSHHAHRVGTDVGLADVIAPHHEDVGLVLRRGRRRQQQGSAGSQ
jgi:hypothetical protein